MDLEKKLTALDQIYRIYDDFSADLVVACKKGCSLCCTHNVILTTLEGYKIVSCLESNDKSILFKKIRLGLKEGRLQARITTNTLADFCIQGKEVPEEEDASMTDKCPILTDDECPVYPLRPFGCRCFVSKAMCRENGWAEVDPYVLTVNTIFLQYIEHIDAKGASGNLTDVLSFMESQENRERYRQNALKNFSSNLISNRPMKVLMIPPEHRITVRPILSRLQQIKVV